MNIYHVFLRFLTEPINTHGSPVLAIIYAYGIVILGVLLVVVLPVYIAEKVKKWRQKP